MKKTVSVSKKKRGAIIKLTSLACIILVGFLLSIFSFHIPFINNGLYKYNSFASSIKLGIDLKGGVYALYEVDSDKDSGGNLSQRLDATRQRLEELIISKGYTEATVLREGGDRLRVEVPDIDNPQDLFNIIDKPASIKFVLESTGETVITGDVHILQANAGYFNDGYGVQLVLNSAGKRIFADVTANNVGGTINIITSVAGEEDSVQPVTIKQAIPDGRPVISAANEDEAEKLASQIIAGSFAVPLRMIETAVISPTLGAEALFWGVIAGAIGLVLVIIFLICFYKLFGVITAIALLLYTVLMLFILAVFPWVQLTLPGIAGIILSLGMAFDANIIIAERVKEDFRKGKSLQASLHSGYRRALSAILDGNVTSIIAGVILLIFGTGAIKGFAIALLIGMIVSMFTSLFIANKITKWFHTIIGDKPNIFGLKSANIDSSDDAPATNDAPIVTGDTANESV